ncbi:MAG: hypothetical protein LBS03_07995 [Bacteroidales bacterium]|jgi:uncharacterized protein YfaS (alpha-2-macroglobulin family)|nr:hypothetical protein [Bacteroidales bacterium]
MLFVVNVLRGRCLKNGLALVLFSVVLWGLSACHESKPDEIHPSIVAYTSGTISVLSPVRVVLADDVVFSSNTEVGDRIEDGIFKFSPSVKGNAFRISENTIEFTPEKPFAVGQEYTVKFKVGKLIDAGKAPGTFAFTINTIIPTFTYKIDGLSLYNKRLPNLYYLSGVVTTSDFIPEEKVVGLLKAEPRISWEHDFENNRHVFRIDSIRSLKNKHELRLLWDGSGIGYAFEKQDILTVPGEDDFGLIEVQVVHSPDQYVQCTFSEAIDERQRFVDYVSLSGGSTLRFSVELNVLKIYPAEREIGVRTLHVAKGLKSYSGRRLAAETEQEVTFEQLDPAVQFVGRGVILPNSDGLFLTFRSVNYKAVYVEVYRIYENNILQFLQINDLKSSREMRRVSKKIAHKTIRLADKKAVNLSTWNTFSFDMAELVNPEPGAIYRIKIKGIDKMTDADSRSDYLENDDYYYYYDDEYSSASSYSQRSRNVLATDIGLTAKSGDKREIYVLASNLVTTDPIHSAQITIFDEINQKVGEGVTDKNGVAVIRCSRKASVIVAQHGKQKSYLKIDRNELSLSNFDVSGTDAQGGLKGFLYGERGVWRPGDTIFLAFMMEDKNKILPADHPVTFELRNPNNQLVSRQVKTSGVNGLYRFTAATGSDALTGVWYARVEVGGKYFGKNLKVETVKPNRLKIDMKFNHIPFLSREGVEGKMSVHWLHGAIARNLPVRITARISRAATGFKNFDDYVFEDRARAFYSEEKTLVDGRLDEKGELSFSEDMDVEDSPGMLRVFLSTRVFEEGGDFSMNEFVTTCSPYPSYVGIRAPRGEGYYHRLEIGEEQTFDVATLAETGEPVSRNIEVDVYNVGWRWWWSSTNGEAQYSSDSYSSPVFSSTVRTQNGKGQFKHKWSNNGYYVVKMTDTESGHVSAVPVYASYPYWYDDNADNGGNNGATLLQLVSEKPSYNVGEDAVISFPSAKGARALVSVESGSGVKQTFWVSCNDANGRITIPATADMVPNVYVHVSLLQPHQHTTNDAPIRLYGVIPLMVEDPQTKLLPEIDLPEVLKPEETFTVKISEKNGQMMSYTLAIVDDGLLDLTHYKTPDPWGAFYAREALGVSTWDIYDYVIGAYGGKIEQLFAIGGDGELFEKSDDSKSAQRFQPVVRYLGPFTVEKGKSNEHKIQLPPYIGSVRTMVVATNGRGFGAAEKTTPVRKPLMTLATLPRVIGPEEDVWLPVTVFAMEDQIKQVNVEISANDIFSIEGNKKQTVTFSSTGDQTVYFRLKTKDRTGVGKITATVNSNGEKASHSIEIDVRNPNPTVFTFAEALVASGKSWDGEYTLPGMKSTNKATIEASYLPPINLGRRLPYLIQYPHGCIEQTTSSVFPQLYLDHVMELSADKKQELETNIKAGLERLKKFITPQGGFGYWPGNEMPDSWGTSYGGHFMLEAENKGYALPAGTKQAWLSYQTRRAGSWKTGEGDALGQAYRLYTLALAKQPDLSAMNRLKETANLPVTAKWRLAAAYALAGKTEAAKSLTANMPVVGMTYANRFDGNFGSLERDQAMILETLTLMQDRQQAFLIVKKLSEVLNSQEWLSTQTTAYSLTAIAKYAENEKGQKEINVEYTDATGKRQQLKSKMPVLQADMNVPPDKTGGGKITLHNNSEIPLYIRVTASGIPAPGNEKASAHGLNLSVRFVDGNNNDINVADLPQGTDFKAIVTVSNPTGNSNYTNLALTEIFPSGWEIVNTRLNDESTDNKSPFDYIDIRDDRIYTYFSLHSGSKKTFVASLSTAYQGRFYLPAFACEAMYDETVRANSDGKWVKVTRN